MVKNIYHLSKIVLKVLSLLKLFYVSGKHRVFHVITLDV